MSSGSTEAAPVNIRVSRRLRLDDDARGHVLKRMSQQLERLGPGLQRASVRFEDVNGPRGGVDTVCRLKLVLAGLPSVLNEARGTEPREAFDRAVPPAMRAARSALRARQTRARRSRRRGE
jgi:hypothetical protein